jgi:hypothetical protein
MDLSQGDYVVQDAGEPGADPWRTALSRRVKADPGLARRVLVMVAGLGGFLGLLLLAHYLPQIANPLRIAGLLWFMAFGFLRFTLGVRPRG